MLFNFSFGGVNSVVDVLLCTCFSTFSGNHEYYTVDVHNWMKKLTSLGIKILNNENVPLPSKEDRSVCLAGVNDPMSDEYMYVHVLYIFPKPKDKERNARASASLSKLSYSSLSCSVCIRQFRFV